MSSTSDRRRSLRSSVKSYRTKSPPPKQTLLTPLNRVVKRTYSKSFSTESPSSEWQDTTLTQCGYLLPQQAEEKETTGKRKSSGATSKRLSRKSFETQTLTQAGFVYYGTPVAENMVYDEEPYAGPKSPSPSKKRKKNKPEGSLKPHARNTRRRGALNTVKSEEVGTEGEEIKLKQELLTRQDFMTTLMPPPKTPHSIRRREVPSSQSPADTPLSTQSQRSRDILRSPLKAKSVNARRRMISPGKNESRKRILQVADSMENADDDSPPNLHTSTTSCIPVKFEPLKDTQSVIATRCERTDEYTAACPDNSVPAGETFGPNRIAGGFKSEISDSYNETNESDDDDIEFGFGSQFDITGLNLKTNNSSQVADSTADSNVSEDEETPKYALRVFKSISTPQNIKNDLGQESIEPHPTHSDHPITTPTTWLLRTSTHHEVAIHQNQYQSSAQTPPSLQSSPTYSSRAAILLPPIQSSSAENPPPVLQTKSQIHDTRRDSSPPTVNSDAPLNLRSPQPKLPPYPTHAQQQQQQQQQQKTATTHHPPAPVPPSQATTVDETTQDSSSPPGTTTAAINTTTVDETTQGSSSPPGITTAAHVTITTTTHAAIATLISSSPPQFRQPLKNANDEPVEADEQDTLARDIGGWEAVRLTDSQLLPDTDNYLLF